MGETRGSWAKTAVARGERVDAAPFVAWLREQLRFRTSGELSEEWGCSREWLRSFLYKDRQTVDVARLDAIMDKEGLTTSYLLASYRGGDMAVISPTRRKLPPERPSYTTRVEIQSQQGAFDLYVTAGEYEDGTLAEVFLKIGVKGDAFEAMLDQWAIAFSVALQCGADFEDLVRKFALRKFDPYGQTDDERIPYAFSATDYIVRWLAMRYGSVRLIAELSEEASARHP
jgi:hypothetical protein